MLPLGNEAANACERVEVRARRKGSAGAIIEKMTWLQTFSQVKKIQRQMQKRKVKKVAYEESTGPTRLISLLYKAMKAVSAACYAANVKLR